MPLSIDVYRPKSRPSFFTLATFSDAILPGIRQLQVGEKRKGLLFIAAHLLNLSCLMLALFAAPLASFLAVFCRNYNLRLNTALANSLQSVGVVAPPAIIAFFFLFAFSLMAANDAFERRQRIRLNPIYADRSVAMREAVSGSYVMHALMLATSLFLACFFLIPLPPARQITDIEFVQTEENTREKVISNQHAQHNARSASHLDRSRPLEAARGAVSTSSSAKSAAKSSSSSSSSSTSTSSSSSSSPSSSSAASASAKTSQVKPQAPSVKQAPQPPKVVQPPLPRPQVAISPISGPAPSPAQLPTFKSVVLPAPSTPSRVPTAIAPSSIQAPQPANLPTSAQKFEMPKIVALTTGGAANQTRQPIAASSSANSGLAAGQPTPVSMKSTASASSDSGAGVNLSPQAIGSAKSGSPNSADAGNGPKPQRSNKSGTGGQSNGPSQGIAVGPVVRTASSAPRGDDGTAGDKGVGDRHNQAGREGNSAESSADIDWTPYMQALQRRIKTAWNPPRNPDTKRVKVLFTVHTNGEMTNLRLISSSGLQIVDAAALKAIENSAPFRPLPEHAPASVDIEFTFDYRVFNGSLR